MAIVAKPTQEIIPIKEIKDGVIITKDNFMHMVLMASTLNFSLKSKERDIAPYLFLLEDAGKKQVNELLKIQIREYIEFIKNFVKTTKIVSKSFYIIVSYSPLGVSTEEGLLGGIFGKFSQTTKDPIGAKEKFKENKLQLQQRVDVVQQGLASSGVRVVPLNTEELIELFYKIFNPGELEKEIITSGA
jgi:hypothetical protein